METSDLVRLGDRPSSPERRGPPTLHAQSGTQSRGRKRVRDGGEDELRDRVVPEGWDRLRQAEIWKKTV